MNIGVDIGGTHILAVLMDSNCKAVKRRCRKEVSIEKRQEQQYIIELIVEAITDVLPDEEDASKKDGAPSSSPSSSSSSKKRKHASFDGAGRLEGIGFAVPGNVDPINGTTRYLPNFGWLEPVDLKKLVLEGLHEAYRGTKVELRNDGRCAAFAEYYFGVGKDRQDMVFSMLTLGTGIGGGTLIDGQLFDGSSFDAGDFGHHVIASGEPSMHCVCGKKGCFETHASAAGLVRHYRRLYERNYDKLPIPHLPLDDARTVMEKFRKGDAVGKSAFRDWLADLSTGLANLITFYNPSCIVLGGGMSKVPELLEELPEINRERLQAEVDKLTLPATRGKCIILTSSLGDDAGAMGAALIVSN